MTVFRSLLCALVLAASPAFAEPPSDTIVVTGKLQDRKAIEHKVASFVRSATVVPEAGQYPRRNDRYCPKIIGLDARYAPRVVAQILDAGRAAGLPDPAPGCKTNLSIIFSEDADGQMARLRHDSLKLFAGLPSGKERELFGSGRPIRWWYLSSKAPAGGGRIAGGTASAIGGEGGAGEGVPGFGGVDTVSTFSSSLIETNIRVDLNGTYVVIDVSKSHGLPLDAVAAYAAMVSFAPINGTQSFVGFPSILSLFAVDDPPKGLTQWDKAYLRALYRIPANREAWIQRGALAAEMMKVVAP